MLLVVTIVHYESPSCALRPTILSQQLVEFTQNEDKLWYNIFIIVCPCHDINILKMLCLVMIWKGCDQLYCSSVFRCLRKQQQWTPAMGSLLGQNHNGAVWWLSHSYMACEKLPSSPGSTSFSICGRLHGFTLVYWILNPEKWLTSSERCLTFVLDLCGRFQTHWVRKMLDCYNRMFTARYPWSSTVTQSPW